MKYNVRIFNLRIIAVSITIFTALQGCTSSSSTPHQSVCSEVAETIAGACRVSPLRLFTQSEYFSEKRIDVILYYPGLGSIFLYAGTNAADSADLTSGVMIGRSLDVEELFPSPGYYRVEGYFSTSLPVTFGEGVTVPEVIGGVFSSIESARKVSSREEMIDGCKIEGCGVVYADGAFLMRTLPAK